MAPAGSFESLAAALRAGADSVYFGVGMYNMRARSTVNFTVEDLPKVARLCHACGAKAYLTKTVNDESVKITVLESFEPSPISETGCESWDKVRLSVAHTWPGCIVTPYLMVQCSDSRHYGVLSNHVYRFSAMDMTAQERRSIHGNNEKIRLESIGRAVEFYLRLMKQC